MKQLLKTENIIAIMLTILVIVTACLDKLNADVVAIFSFVLGYFFSDTHKEVTKK